MKQPKAWPLEWQREKRKRKRKEKKIKFDPSLSVSKKNMIGKLG